MMHQPAPGKPYVEPNITVNDRLIAVDKFTYLGSTLCRNVMIDGEVNARLAKASVAFGRLQKRVEQKRDHHRDEDQGLPRNDSHYTAEWL